jgi:uncharacterized tellurite resistance protein B-like protein
MLSAIRSFFDQHIAGPAGEPGATAEERARVAAAALLVEVVNSDDHFSEVERAAVLDAVRRRFGLDPAAARQLLELAQSAARVAHDYYQFTSQINASFSPERKRRLVEELWQVAYADDVLNRYEEHLIRRVSDLLHVSHGDFIRAKLKAQAARQRSGRTTP